MASSSSSPVDGHCSRSSTKQASTSNCGTVEPPMNGPCPSESASSTLPWLWAIQAVSTCKQINISFLKETIDVAPLEEDDFCEKTRELIALRCLEDLFDYAYKIHCDAKVYGNLDPKPGLDFSSSCEDVLQQILDKIPLLDLKEVGAELLKWDISPFIVHKRATIKSDLEQLKESIIQSTHPYTDCLRERSGLAQQNGGNRAHVNDNECSNLSKKDNGNCSSHENMEAKENSVSVILENETKSSKESLCDKILPSKRNRVESTNEHDMEYQHEKHIDINECDDYLISAKKVRCSASLNVESNKEKDSPLGKPLLENSNEKFLLVSERRRHHLNKDVRENQGEGCVEGIHGSHDRCIASNWCKSSSHNQVSDGESNLPFNATTMLQHTSECEPCQQHEGEPTPLEVFVLDKILHGTKDGTENKDPKIINESQPIRKLDLQLKEPTAADDKALDDTVNACGQEISRYSDGYHNETIDLPARKHEFLSSRSTFGDDILVSAGLTEKRVCIKCNEVGELLFCQRTTCPIMVHKSCLSTSAQIDAEGNFFCPFCAHRQAISEYREAKKEASLARKELAIFMCKDIGHQNMSYS